MGEIVKIVILLACGFGCSYANAGSFQLGIEGGSASPYDDDYKRSDVIHLVAGYEFIDDVLLAEVGVFEFDDDFGLKNSPASIGLDGTDFQISTIFGFGPVDVVVGAGRFYWDAAAYFDNRQVGEDSGSSWLYDIRLSWDLGSRLGLYVDGKHLRDISGDDINLVMLGSRFSF
jgi:hypothetical protein